MLDIKLDGFWLLGSVSHDLHADFKKIFPFKFAHLGGDEVDTSKVQLWPYKKQLRI
jgi:hypothetical protein